MTQPEWKKLHCKSKKRNKSEGKILYHCNLTCVSSKPGMHGGLRCLKILYIHNCWNLVFVLEPLWNSDNQTFSTIVQYHLLQYNYFYYRLVLIAQLKIPVLATLVGYIIKPLQPSSAILQSSAFHRGHQFGWAYLLDSMIQWQQLFY